MNKIAFITGSRSEVGALKGVIEEIDKRSFCDYCIIMHGAHNLEFFGNTSDELKMHFASKIFFENTISEITEDKKELFVNSISKLYSILKKEKVNYVYIIGDRIEAYAAALAAHLLNLIIFHYGGGNISNGSNDNIYRYNITNLAHVHLATSLFAFKRLKALPIITKEKVYFVGSSAVDSIITFLEQPVAIGNYIPELSNRSFVLMTFHPDLDTNKRTIQIMDFIIHCVIKKEKSLLITYPNHDVGFQDIIDVIEKWKHHELVHVVKHLGKIRYYSAVYSSQFVIGNTSSGFVEVPYFSKVFYNIGSRQDGRDGDDFIMNLGYDKKLIAHELNTLEYVKKMKGKNNTKVYGNGDAASKIIDIIKNEMQSKQI
ncbi:MAG: UDP-N-acetylglucosamine 2-epimerase [bacterium]